MLGTARNRGDAPFDDESVEIWGVSGVLTATDVKRVDTIFEMHPRRFWADDAILRVLNGHGGDVWMQDHYDEVPNSRAYPIDVVRNAFYMPTMGDTLYVTNTVSYMLAMALLMGYDDIETFGIWMEAEGEYGYQRPNCEFFLGYAHAMGVKVKLNGGDVLKANFLYGYEEPRMLAALVEEGKQLQNGMDELQRELEETKRRFYHQEGGIKYNKQLRRRFGGY
jgi:hypothetical protein